MTDIILVAVIGAMVAAAAWYIIRAKRSGARCIGCSAGGCCSRARGASSHCACGEEQEHGCCCHTGERESDQGR